MNDSEQTPCTGAAACEASASVKQAIELYAPAGPLTGKVLSAVVIWLVAWAGLHMVWRGRNVPHGTPVAVTLVLVAFAFVTTFPPPSFSWLEDSGSSIALFNRDTTS